MQKHAEIELSFIIILHVLNIDIDIIILNTKRDEGRERGRGKVTPF